VLGSVLFVLSLVPWALAPIVPFLGLEPARAAAVVGGLVAGAEAVGLLALAVLGKETHEALRTRWRERGRGENRCPR
jgi:hypothetical protein